MNTLIREAQFSDIDSLYQIFSKTDQLHKEAHPEIFRNVEDIRDTEEYYLSCMESPAAMICVAEIDNKLVGGLIATLQEARDIPVLVPRNYACVENITVIETYSRKGIGEALMKYAHEWAKRKRATSMELTVWEFNQGAAAFYNQLGYKTYRRRMFKDLA